MERLIYSILLIPLMWVMVSCRCPKQCECTDLSNTRCINKGITDGDLAEIARNLDPEVQFLHLERNDITHFKAEDFIKSTKLRKVFLTENSLTKVPVNISHFLPAVFELQLGKNKIHAIGQTDFEGYHSITYLDISGNNIQKLGSGIFQTIPNLDTLNAMNNGIKRLENGVFKGLTKAKNIYLNGNGLTSIEPEVFEELPSLETVYLQDNKLVCDCTLYHVINSLHALSNFKNLKGKCNEVWT